MRKRACKVEGKVQQGGAESQRFSRGSSRDFSRGCERQVEVSCGELGVYGLGLVFAVPTLLFRSRSESQRDCASKPWVARHELPWVEPFKIS